MPQFSNTESFQCLYMVTSAHFIKIMLGLYSEQERRMTLSLFFSIQPMAKSSGSDLICSRRSNTYLVMDKHCHTHRYPRWICTSRCFAIGWSALAFLW